MLRATAWSTSTLFVGQALRVLANLVVSRLLAPDVFGLMAIVLIIQSLIYMLCDVGLVQLVMRSKRDNDAKFLNTIWTVQIGRGFLIWGLGLFIALLMLIAGRNGLLPFGSAWNAPELPALIAVTMFGTVISGCQSARVLLAYRDMHVKQLALIELAAQITGIIVMISLAIFVKSAWVFVLSGLVSSMLTTVLGYWILPGPRERLAWDKATLAEIYGAGGWIILGSLSYVASANADRLLLAGWVSPTELGLYSVPVSLIALIEMVGTRVVGTILQPALNETARTNPTALRAQLHRLRLTLDASYLLVAGTLFAIAQPLISLIYDPRYAAAGHVLQILSFTLLFSRYQHIVGSVYFAMGHPQLMAGIAIIRLVAILIMLPIGFHFGGFEGALIAIVLHQVPGVLTIFCINHRHNLNDFWLELRVLPAWFAGAFAGFSSLAIMALLH